MAEQNMQGKKLIVTGAGIGLGRAMAMHFAEHGAAVALHYAKDFEDAPANAKKIRDEGGIAKAFKADFCDLDQTMQFAQDAIDFLGGVDIVINNAGITVNCPFESTTVQQYEAMYAVNVRSSFFVTQAAVPAMVDGGGGSIINMTSVHAFAGAHEHSVYAGTKGAIVAQTRVLAVELGTKNIRVNAIAPGFVPTDSYAKVAPDMDMDAITATIPVGRVGTPQDIAQLAMFLASDQLGYISGQTFLIDGGLMAHMSRSDNFHRPIDERWGNMYVSNPKQR